MTEPGGDGTEPITSLTQVPAMEEKFWQDSLKIHEQHQAETVALRARQANEAQTEGTGIKTEDAQKNYEDSLQTAVDQKTVAESTVPAVKEKEVDNTIYDYFVVSTQPVLEATAFMGIFPGNDREQPVRLKTMPEKTILEINTMLGPRYFKESGPIIRKTMTGRTPSSQHPKFLDMMLPTEKDSLKDSGWQIIKAYDLLPQDKKL